VTNLTIGVVGFGNVGRKVGERWAGFDPEVLAYDPYVDDETTREHGATPADLDETLQAADVVSIHARLTDDTHHMLGAEAFERMGEDTLLVNTARGGLVDTDALVEALQSGSIGGAALDVFEEEPIPEGHPLLDLDNVWLSPTPPDRPVTRCTTAPVSSPRTWKRSSRDGNRITASSNDHRRPRTGNSLLAVFRSVRRAARPFSRRRAGPRPRADGRRAAPRSEVRPRVHRGSRQRARA